MKRITLSVLMIIAGGSLLWAQENNTVESESITKKVTIKEGSNVIVKETQETVQKKGKVLVEGSNEHDQPFQEKTVKVAKDQKIVKDQERIDQANEERKVEILREQEEELKRSKMELMEKAEARRRELEEKKAAQMKAMEERRAKLMKRGKGVNKLKKKKGNN